MPKIYLMDGSEEVKPFDFDNSEVFVGRSPDNDIQIRDSFVSRRHLRIIRKGDRYLVRDLKSRNGTFVDGKQISPDIDIEVTEGQVLTILNRVKKLPEVEEETFWYIVEDVLSKCPHFSSEESCENQ